MKSKQIVYNLGYIILFCIILYIVFGQMNVVEGFDKNVQENLNEKYDELKKWLKEWKEGEDKMRKEVMPENINEIRKILKEAFGNVIRYKTDALAWQLMSVHDDKRGIQAELELLGVTGRGSVSEIMNIKNFLSLLDDANNVKSSTITRSSEKKQSTNSFGF